MSAFTSKHQCRLCEGRNSLVPVLKLKDSPLANAFTKEKTKQATYPLELLMCTACSHVQLSVVVDPEILFGDYKYVSGTSASFRQHFAQAADHYIERFNLPNDAVVVDIGGNDGTALDMFKDRGMTTVNFEPAQLPASVARAKGHDVLREFFTLEAAHRFTGEFPPADLVIANNVLAHIDDLDDVMQGVRTMLRDGGVLVFEVQYLLDLVQKAQFDNIYHEHLDYHRVQALVPFLWKHGLSMFDVQRIPTHGGSIRVFVELAGAKRKYPTSPAIKALIELERREGLGLPGTYGELDEKIQCAWGDVQNALKGLNPPMVAYGAAAKFTTFVNEMDLAKYIVSVVDDSKHKQGLYTPLGHVIGDRSLMAGAKTCIVTAWNFADEIRASNHDYKGSWIVPFPHLEVYR